MVYKKCLLGLILFVLALPLVVANESFENNSFLDDELDVVSGNVMLDDEFASCSAVARDVCLMFPDFGLVEGASMPYVLPKNGILNLEFQNGTAIGSAVLSSGEISEIVCCTSRDDFTHVVSVSSFEVVEEIKGSDDFLFVAQSKLSSGDIVISANSFSDKTRLVLAKAALKIMSWFK
ncbi:MAG: hypothetical protein ACLFN8_04110 [Candidatus Woesearchaeota archaeon]